MKANEYELKTIEDVVMKIPKDRIEAFLFDFKLFIESTKGLVELVDILGDEAPEIPKMVWIDDGENNMSVNIGIKKETNPNE